MTKPNCQYLALPRLHITVFAVLAATSLALPINVSATSVCRWVDDAGQVQISDQVPSQYTNIAVCRDYPHDELTARQRQQAEQRVADQKSRAEKETPVAIPPVDGTPPKLALKIPAEVITEATDCQTRWRLYDESGACFGPFNTVGGGIKQEAFDKCNEVPNPEVKCGPRRD